MIDRVIGTAVARLRTLAIAISVVLWCEHASAQQMSAAELLASGGVHAERNYFSPESWEHFDIASGNLLLTFTDLELPGNAGRSLKLQRVFNSNGAGTLGSWLFGIAGMPMFITDPPLPPSGYNFNNDMSAMLSTTPVVVMADGAARRTAYLQQPVADGTMNNSVQYVRTADFMLYDRVGHTLLMPDGTVARYEPFDSPAPGYTRYALKEFNDPFTNLVQLDRSEPGLLTVTQELGSGESRTVTYTFDANGNTASMTFLNRSWVFDWTEIDPGKWQIESVHLPTNGLSWEFAYGGPNGAMSEITLPTGGRVVYGHDARQIYDTRYPGDPTHSQWVYGVFTQRSAFDRDDTPRGVWALEVGPCKWTPHPLPLARSRHRPDSESTIKMTRQGTGRPRRWLAPAS